MPAVGCITALLCMQQAWRTQPRVRARKKLLWKSQSHHILLLLLCCVPKRGCACGQHICRQRSLRPEDAGMLACQARRQKHTPGSPPSHRLTGRDLFLRVCVFVCCFFRLLLFAAAAASCLGRTASRTSTASTSGTAMSTTGWGAP